MVIKQLLHATTSNTATSVVRDQTSPGRSMMMMQERLGQDEPMEKVGDAGVTR